MSAEIGSRFGRLLVEKSSDFGGKRRWIVRCDCGKRRTVLEHNLVSGHTTSCGCYRVERVKEASTKHGHRAHSDMTAEYAAWRSMLARCYDPACDSYEFYGQKGVTVVDEWRDNFETFLKDVGQRPSDVHLVSRKDKAQPFGPTNFVWMTKHESGRNRIDNTFYTVNKVTKCLVDWASEYDIPKSTLHYRVVTKGMTMRDALDVGRGRSGKLLPQ